MGTQIGFYSVYGCGTEQVPFCEPFCGDAETGYAEVPVPMFSRLKYGQAEGVSYESVAKREACWRRHVAAYVL